MKKLFLITITCLLWFSTSFAQSYSVGYRSQTFRDADRSNRSVRTIIYYPATSAGSNRPIADGSFPVIVLGHGFVMGSNAYQNFYDELVPQGYIVVFVNTEGSIFANHDAFSKDMAFMVNAMQNENNVSGSIFQGKINNKTALLGHSMGGGAATVAASMVSVATLVTFAPTQLRVNTLTPATQVAAPSIVFSGSSDGVTPPNQEHLPIYNNLGSTCKYFISILGGAHCYYANSNFNCDFGENFSSGNIQISRSEQQAITFQFLNSWLAYTLKNDLSALQTFLSDLESSTTIAPQNDCSNTAITSKVVLFPNPTSQSLSVQISESHQFAKVELYNEQGNLMLSSPRDRVNVAHLKKGHYFVKIYLKNHSVVKKQVLIR
ncbi:hypothetical protein BKI52_26420 [marine bacterium AO1-C]|nr:hypothetical protein BKI52_26420 [marine bacterium AO1-C]